jgi:restriction system protein
MDITFHFPPELFQLLIDTVPKLCKSKQDLLLFFQGAGVPKRTLGPYQRLLNADKSEFNKYLVTRELLGKLNEQGEQALAIRRELLKRIVEFDDFTVCWENDRAAARGLVAQVRDLINVKDSFTRMSIEKDTERRRRLEEQDAAAKERQRLKAERDKVKADLFALFGERDAHKRGKALEAVLNRLFASCGLLVREAFTIKGKCGEGIIEQIDGLVEIDGILYLVEMKWWNAPLGSAEIAPHLVRVFSRGGQVRGLFISYTDFTDSAISQCKDAIVQGKVIVLSVLEEIVSLLNQEADMKVWLKTKVDAALVDKQPFYRVRN